MLLLVLTVLAGCAPRSRSRRSDYYYEPAPGTYHVVEKGQTLWRIAGIYGVSVEEISRANAIQNPDAIENGQRLFIPGLRDGTKSHTIPLTPKPKTKSKPKPKPKQNSTLRRVVRHVEPEAESLPVAGRFVWPVKGALQEGPEEENFLSDDGINILAPPGTEIQAASAGKVIYSDSKMNFYGNMIIIKHDSSYFTIYAHNAENLVRPEESVAQGQVIGRVGQSGRATVSCLHFEIRKGEEPLNPLSFLPEIK